MTECVITNAGNAAGYGNGSEVGTTCKCAVTDTGNAGRDGNGSEIVAICECAITNTGYFIWYGILGIFFRAWIKNQTFICF